MVDGRGEGCCACVRARENRARVRARMREGPRRPVELESAGRRVLERAPLPKKKNTNSPVLTADATPLTNLAASSQEPKVSPVDERVCVEEEAVSGWRGGNGRRRREGPILNGQPARFFKRSLESVCLFRRVGQDAAAITPRPPSQRPTQLMAKPPPGGGRARAGRKAAAGAPQGTPGLASGCRARSLSPVSPTSLSHRWAPQTRPPSCRPPSARTRPARSTAPGRPGWPFGCVGGWGGKFFFCGKKERQKNARSKSERVKRGVRAARSPLLNPPPPPPHRTKARTRSLTYRHAHTHKKKEPKTRPQSPLLSLAQRAPTLERKSPFFHSPSHLFHPQSVCPFLPSKKKRRRKKETHASPLTAC
jgi:hypothetical protein